MAGVRRRRGISIALLMLIQTHVQTSRGDGAWVMNGSAASESEETRSSAGGLEGIYNIYAWCLE